MLFIVALCGTVAFTSCSKKLGEMTSDFFTTTPTPLEVVADCVPGTVTGTIPAKFFVKDAEVKITPVLVYGDQEVTSLPYNIQGENVRGNNQVISYDNGATVTVPFKYDYVEDMLKSDLFLDFVVTQGSKSYNLPRVKVGYGVVATATLADAGSVNAATAVDKFQKVVNEKYDANIMFLINKADVRASETNSEAVVALNQKIKDTKDNAKLEVEGISIESYASPEGGVEFNTRLAENRELNTKAYLQKTLKGNKVDDFGELTANFTAQDWEGFQKLVSESNIQDKDLILSVLSMYSDPEEREREIRNMSSVFDQLKQDILPKLRYSKLTASINVIGKSDDELKDAYANNPETLSVDEILYTATLYKDNAKKAEIYAKAAELYPNDYRTYNNLGVAQYKEGNVTAATANFLKAASLQPQSGEPQMNLGLVDLLNKDYAAANAKFGNAAGVTELPAALGTYYIQSGDYANAVSAFGDTKSNNAAIAQILNKDYSKAAATLAAISEPNATTYYLQALVAARTNNEQAVYSNLRKVSGLDKNLLERAKNDVEFANYNVADIN